WRAAVAVRQGDSSATRLWLARAARTHGAAMAGAQPGRAWVTRDLERGLPTDWPPTRPEPELLEARALLGSALVASPEDPDLLEAYAQSFLHDVHPDSRALGAVLAASEARPRRTTLLGVRCLLLAHGGELGAALNLVHRFPTTA